MKVFLTFLVILMPFFGSAQDTIKVSSIQEFIRALGSDRTIEVKLAGKEWLYINELTEKEGDFYSFNRYGLTVKNVQNLTIVGKGTKPVKLVTKNEDHKVLDFENVTNLTLDNIELGHIFGGKSCTASVLLLDQCKNVVIKNCILFGSGINGLSASNTEKLKLENTTIISCTQNAIELGKCNEVSISNCLITDNVCRANLFSVRSCFGVDFDNCEITHNVVPDCETYAYQHSMFNVVQSMEVSLKNCNIQGNCLSYFVNKKTALELTDSRPIENKFMGFYKED